MADKKIKRADALSAAKEVNIPEAELTPHVQSAIDGLLHKQNKLRAELDDALQRVHELEKLADRDAMLDILNRRAFVRELERSLALIDRHGIEASVIFVDVNGLKKINDEKGHSAGDAALMHVVTVLLANIRQSDVIGRLGGDEFGVLLSHASVETAREKAESLAALTAAQPVKWYDGEFSVSISCGAAGAPKGVSAQKAIDDADAAMYEQKRRA